jgi:hypothetical protein
MCVIAFSPKGVDIPTESQLRQMWNCNPDGAGYAYVDKKGSVVYRKGFLTFESLLKELEAPERFKNTNFAIHFRIGTSGKNDGATCHPFPISNNFGELRKTEGVAESVLFHNGILSNGGIVSPLASDTQDFVVAMTPLLKKYNRSKARDHFIGQLIKGNRLLILYKNNTFKMFGDWQKDGDIWVSNLNYKYDYSWYGSGYYGGGWQEYGYDDYGYFGLRPAKKVEDKKTNVTPIQTDETNDMWLNIIEKEYMFLDNEEQLQLLKDSADSYTKSQIELGGYVLGYDDTQLLVWLEDTPILDTTETTEEE